MEAWYEIEYSYNRPRSDKIKYKGLKEFKTREEAEKFAAVVYWLSKKDKLEYDARQLKVSKEYLGKGQFVALKRVYVYAKKEIKFKLE